MVGPKRSASRCDATSPYTVGRYWYPGDTRWYRRNLPGRSLSGLLVRKLRHSGSGVHPTVDVSLPYFEDSRLESVLPTLRQTLRSAGQSETLCGRDSSDTLPVCITQVQSECHHRRACLFEASPLRPSAGRPGRATAATFGEAGTVTSVRTTRRDGPVESYRGVDEAETHVFHAPGTQSRYE
jgi:hypothetical protein